MDRQAALLFARGVVILACVLALALILPGPLAAEEEALPTPPSVDQPAGARPAPDAKAPALPASAPPAPAAAPAPAAEPAAPAAPSPAPVSAERAEATAPTGRDGEFHKTRPKPTPKAKPKPQSPAPDPGRPRDQVEEEQDIDQAAEELFDGREPLGMHWDAGLWMVDKPKRFTLKLNVRMDMDWAGINDDKYVAAGGRVGNTPSQGQLRRFRVTMRGQLGRYSYWKTALEFTDSTAALRDNFLQTRWLDERFGVPFPELRIGNFFEPFSLEQNTPSGRLSFMERSAATQALGLGRSLGLMAFDQFSEGRFGYQVGVFTAPVSGFGDLLKRVDDDSVVVDGGGVTGRIWWMPWGKCRGPCRRLLFGTSFSERIGISGIQYRARPESQVFDHVVDTDFSVDAAGNPLLNDAHRADLLALESAWSHGRFSAQAEYYFSRVASTNGGNPLFHGGYALLSYWLTGECRNIGDGKILETKICDPMDHCKPLNERGLGGIEVAARFSTLNLNDGRIAGGKIHTFALGVNWHLANRNRLILNVIAADVNDGFADDIIWILSTRFQLQL